MANVHGLDAVKRELRALERKTEGGVVRILEAVGEEMRGEAIERTPVDMGKLRQANTYSVDRGNLTAKLHNDSPYAAFQEFGTGSFVSVPQELQQVAKQFKGQKGGNFDEFVENIRQWCKRHSIDEKAAYVIAMSILKRGLKPHPFLYPAFLKGKQIFLQQIEALVKSVR